MYVRWNKSLSDGFRVTNGGRQGGVLSPYLFCIYMDNLSNKLNNQNVGCFVGSRKINHLMYADDLVIISPSASGLNKLLKVCEQYGIKYDIKHNSSKSSVLIFTCQKLKQNVFTKFTLNGDEIPVKREYRYLGRILCDTPSDNVDIERQCKRLYTGIQGNVQRMSRTRVRVPVEMHVFHISSIKIKLFQSYSSVVEF